MDDKTGSRKNCILEYLQVNLLCCNEFSKKPFRRYNKIYRKVIHADETYDTPNKFCSQTFCKNTWDIMATKTFKKIHNPITIKSK